MTFASDIFPALSRRLRLLAMTVMLAGAVKLVFPAVAPPLADPAPAPAARITLETR